MLDSAGVVVDLLRREDCSGLVEDEQTGASVQSFQDLDALLQADRQVGDALPWVHLQAEPLRQLIDHAAGPIEIHDAAVGDLAPEDDVLGDGQRRDEHEMLVDHPDAELDGVLGSVDLHRPAVEDDLARVRPDQAVDDVHQGRLAGPVFPQQRMDLAPIDGQVHAIVRPQLPEGLHDPSELQGATLGVYEVTPVVMVPAFSLASMSVILALTSEEIFESKLW